MLDGSDGAVCGCWIERKRIKILRLWGSVSPCSLVTVVVVMVVVVLVVLTLRKAGIMDAQSQLCVSGFCLRTPD